MVLLLRTGGFKKRTGVLCSAKYSLNPLEKFLKQYLTNIETIAQKSSNFKLLKTKLDNKEKIKPYKMYNF
jgi:hypothetical protein